MPVRHWTYKLLRSKAAKSHADLQLVLDDLRHAKLCCHEILARNKHPLVCHVSHALFDSCVVRYRRCFNDGARARIDKLLAGLTPEEKNLHAFIVTLVNKHTAHSENQFEVAHSRLYISISDDGELTRGAFGGGTHRTLALSLQTIETISALVERLIALTNQWRKEIERRLAKEVVEMSDEEIRLLPDDPPFVSDFDVSRPRRWD
jgi:hypothetical protein